MVTCIGSDMGKVALNETTAITNQQINSIVVDGSRFDTDYLYYKMVQYYPVLRRAAGGTTALPLLNKTDFSALRIQVHSRLDVQKRIASVLSALDAKITLNQRINAELEAMAKLLYDYWFVQFDFPNAKGNPYKSSGGRVVYNAELKREVPEGWEVDTLLRIADYENGLACQRFRPTGPEFLRVIKIKEMRDGFTDSTELVRPDIPAKAVIENGDVLFSWSASLEVMLWAGGKGALNQHIFKVSSEAYPRSFYYHQLLNYLQHFRMQAENRKTTMGHITLDHLRQSRIVIPPMDLVKALDEKLKPIHDLMVANSIQNRELTALRDWLLPLLMNGQVTVGAAEEKVGLAMAAEAGAVYGKKRK